MSDVSKGFDLEDSSASEWHIPASLQRVLPDAAIRGLRNLKARIKTRGFVRRLQFLPSQDDLSASESFSVIVPIHDAPEVTRRCLGSLSKFAPEAEVILVDDASRLPETKSVIGHFSQRNHWKTVYHEKAGGHSAACWAGGKMASRPYLCLLNSDTVVTPWCWRLIKKVFESDAMIGVAGPSTSNAGNQQTLPVASTFLPYWTDNQICNFAGHLATSQQGILDLPWVSGFAFFIRRSLWTDLGGFDRNLPDYGNEVELCKRVVSKRFRNVWVRDSYIHHLGRQSYRSVVGDAGILARIEAAKAYAETPQSLPQ